MVSSICGTVNSDSVEILAETKKLEANFLLSLGVADLPKGGVAIPYYGADGEELFTRMRGVPGKPRFLQPKGQALRPYGLWRDDARRLGVAYFAEGESDAWSLWASGLPALGVPGAQGAKAIDKEDVGDLSDIFLLPDNDAAGEKFVEGVSKRLAEIGWNGRLWRLRIPSPHKDVCDWRAADPDRFAEQLRDALGQRERVAAAEKKPAGAVEGASDYHLTDVGNGQRLRADHGSILRYCPPWRTFLIWDGKRWKVDVAGDAVGLVKKSIKSLFDATVREIARVGHTADKETIAKLQATLRHCTRWESAGRVEASLQMLQSEPGIPVLPDDLDKSPWLLNVDNGTIDLRTGELRPHKQEDYLTKLIPVRFDPAAECPLWKKCLDTWMMGNRDLIAYLQRVAGYSLTGDVSEQVVFLHHGGGDNGKTTFANVLLDLMGEYGRFAVNDLLLQRSGEAHLTERADLAGRRFVLCSEIDEGRKLAESLTKSLSGGEKLSARRMRQDLFQIEPTWKIHLAANHKPIIRGTDHAIWRRIRLIPWNCKITADQKIQDLNHRLMEEAEGILAWAVAGCLAWRKVRLSDPPEVLTATNEYRDEQDGLTTFISENCTKHPDLRTTPAALLDAFHKWAGDKTMTASRLKGEMEKRGFTYKKSNGARFFSGIGLDSSNFSGEDERAF
jgi:putative DNA primase/helicase